VTLTATRTDVYPSMRDFIARIRRNGLVRDIAGADWNIEIGTLTEAVAFSASPSAMLFDDIPGYAHGQRVATNLYCTEQLQAIALGLPDDVKGIDAVRAWRERSKDIVSIPPRVVTDGPIRENVDRGDDVDLTKFPIPFWHEHDGGRFFGTGDLVITRDPEEQWVNVAPYRAQLHDRKTLGLMISRGHHGYIQLEKFWAAGQDAPVAIVAGQDPDTYAGACLPLAWGKSEYDWAGGLRGEAIEVIVEPRTGLPIPAHCEIVAIGFVPSPTKELMQEGPFGECTGYYTETGQNLVVHVEEVWYRDGAILQGNPTMHGSSKMHALGGEIFTSAMIWDSVSREVPDVVGVYSLYQPCQAGSFLVAVSIKQRYPGHAKQAALAALASHGAVFMNKAIVVVDDDIDPADLNDVIFAITTRCNPAEDMDVIRGIPGLMLDPRIPPERRAAGDSTTSTMIINACRPWSMRNSYPRVNIVSKTLRDEAIAKWGHILNL
jgi:UbiD family decarboxylase